MKCDHFYPFDEDEAYEEIIEINREIYFEEECEEDDEY